MEKMGKEDDGLDKRILIALGVAAGLVLLLLGNGTWGLFDNEQSTPTIAYDETVYEEELRQKIVDICSKVKGVGKVSVAITLDGSFKSVLVQNTQSNGETSKTEYVLIGSGSSESAVTIGYTAPKILGVGIVCEGAEDASVRREMGGTW